MNARAVAAAIAVATTLALATTPGAAADIAPQGLYFHAFSGAAVGSEWSTWGPRPGVNRYEFSDLSSGGTYPGTISSDGAIAFDFGHGSGAFHDQDTATIDFTLSGGLVFHSEIRRAPYTDERFPVFFTGAVTGEDARTGSWSAVIRSIDPSTGQTLDERTELVEVSSIDSTIRLTLAGGDFFQGVWVADDQASFRIIHPAARLPRYRTIPGSMTSVELDMVGEVRVTGADTMYAVLAFQTRTPLGTQVQTLTHISLTRVPAPGALTPLTALGLALGRRRRAIACF